MTTYLAVVKYAVDDPPEAKRRALKQGVSDIAMELVAEHGLTPEDLELLFEDAYSDGQYEYQLKQERESG